MGQMRFLGAIQRNGSSSSFTRAECRRQLLTFFLKHTLTPSLGRAGESGGRGRHAFTPLCSAEPSPCVAPVPLGADERAVPDPLCKKQRAIKDAGFVQDVSSASAFGLG